MPELNGKLITFYARDGLKLKGYLATSGRNEATIIHVHGNCGNFYENDFISVMADRYTNSGINFLTVNNRGHDGLAEAYHHGRLVYVGGAYENLEECSLDIEGAVTFAESLGARVILQGHSFGCLKTLIYLVNSPRRLDFILLSPSDTYQLQCNYVYPETVEDQLDRISTQYGQTLAQLLPPTEFGIKQSGIEYYIPITAATFISYFTSPWLRVLRYQNPLTYHLKSRCFLYCGGADALRTEHADFIKRFFTDRVTALHFCYCETGDHHFHSLESYVADEIIRWVTATHS